ncbi:hypothetical protein J6590_071611 [Homalodisca vitripennis]|nr:hypothetical protein J6590_071611 [Homalodisca vitripennis]
MNIWCSGMYLNVVSSWPQQRWPPSQTCLTVQDTPEMGSRNERSITVTPSTSFINKVETAPPALGVPMVEWSKTLDFQSGLEIAQVRILSVTVALFISTIDLVLYRLSPYSWLIRTGRIRIKGGSAFPEKSKIGEKFLLIFSLKHNKWTSTSTHHPRIMESKRIPFLRYDVNSEAPKSIDDTPDVGPALPITLESRPWALCGEGGGRSEYSSVTNPKSIDDTPDVGPALPITLESRPWALCGEGGGGRSEYSSVTKPFISFSSSVGSVLSETCGLKRSTAMVGTSTSLEWTFPSPTSSK